MVPDGELLRASKEFRVVAGVVHRLLLAYCWCSPVVLGAAVDQLDAFLRDSVLREGRGRALVVTAVTKAAEVLGEGVCVPVAAYRLQWIVASPGARRVDPSALGVVAGAVMAVLREPDRLVQDVTAAHLEGVDWVDPVGVQAVVTEAVRLTAQARSIGAAS